MKIKIYILSVLLLNANTLWAYTSSSNFATYYSSLNSKSASELRESLTTLVTNKHTTTLAYNWVFDGIDIVDSEVLDIYSTCEWTPTDDQCGSVSGICGCYNREHVVPQSLFNEVLPQKGDRHHLFLTDGKVNGVRSNFPYGTTNSTNGFSGITNSGNALGKFGTSSNAACSGNVYEPDDMYKGDIARAILYMAIRYATASVCTNGYPVTSWSSNAMFSNSLSPNYGLSTYAKDLLMSWHRSDPVSQKEINRNNGVEDKQGNRNPFIDYPELAEYIWGCKAGETFTVSSQTPYVNNACSSSSCTNPTLSATNKSVTVGSTVSSSVSTNSSGTQTYSSSNTSVATVNSSGTITGKAAGTATITVNVAASGSYCAASTTFTVTVSSSSSSSSYSGYVTECAAPVQYAITFNDNVQSTSGYTPKQIQVTQSQTFTFPTLSDVSVTAAQKSSGTCQEQHYHFIGWVLEAQKDSPTDSNVKKGGSTSDAVSAAAVYYAVWAKEQ